MEQSLSALNIDTSTSLLLCPCGLTLENKSFAVTILEPQLHRMRAASSRTKTDEPVLCGLFYSGITGIAGEDGEAEQQHP